jgi:hypothetical protein
MAVSNFLSENALIPHLALIGSTACTGDIAPNKVVEKDCYMVKSNHCCSLLVWHG